MSAAATPSTQSTLAGLPQIVCVTGTDTGVGKTICTAAIAAALVAAGRTVAVYKPTQAGIEDGGGDIDTVGRLAQISGVHEGIRLEHPMAPVAAAARSGATLPSAEAHLAAINRLAADHQHLLVEGAGGLLVELDHDHHTLADIAVALGDQNEHRSAGVVVVARAALGTLNHTALTLEALAHRQLPVIGVVIGSWPQDPTQIDLSNLEYLRSAATPLIGAIPAGAGQLTPATFREQAPSWFTLAG